jgi:hypothetical protein
MAVVFQVLAAFGLAGVFQPGLEFGQHVIQRQLLRYTGIVVAQRQVGCLARLQGKADADNARLHLVQAGGFGVQRHQRTAAQLVQPALQCGIVQNGVVMAADGAGWRGNRRRCGCRIGHGEQIVSLADAGGRRIQRAGLLTGASSPSVISR